MNLEQIIELYNERGLGQTFGGLQASPNHRPGTAVRYALAELVDFWVLGKPLDDQPAFIREMVNDVRNNNKIV